MHFCKSQQRPRQKVPPHIILGGIPIPYEQSTKFLGVIFDQNLTWNNHILNLRQSSLSALNILKTVSGRDWGADQPSLLRLYHALIRSRLDYACQIYSSASATSLRSLDTVHHQALRLCTGAYRTSPVESLYVLSGDLPLSNRREQLLLSFYFKCKSFRKIPSFDVVNNVRLRDTYNTKRSASVPAHIRALRLLEEGSDCPLKVSESRNFDTPPWCKPIPEFCPMEQSKSGHLPYIVAASFEEHKESHADSIAVYTDGSKSPAGVGCAAVTSSQTFTAKLPFTSSVFTAELYAILLALKHFILNSDFNDFTIYSDSQSSILALTNFIPSHPVISEIQEWLTRTAAREKTVRFCWSPGHVGIIGNEKADRAAKSAVARPLPSRGDSPFSDIRTTISSRVRRKFNTTWDNIRTNQKLRSIKCSADRWPLLSHHNRFYPKLLNRLRIGHTKITHEFLFSLPRIPPSCERCGSPFSVRHFLLECRYYEPWRRKWGLPPDLRKMLGATPMIQPLVGFLKDVNLFYYI
ncbi:uncharacterized protein LOC143023464 [Oratosquilla oratoria]|uniref:uncharacterized protein LOC143023464 n=1 Tax=Oratosquilla oratoria TaxID=337810 RepID=UPI003F7660C4